MIQKLLLPVPSAFIALAVYGSWAAFSNMGFGIATTVTAFFTQGGFAFVSTLCLGTLSSQLYRALGSNLRAYRLTLFIFLVVLASLPATLHWLLMTPNILQSVLPGFVFGSGYLIALLTKHHRARPL